MDVKIIIPTHNRLSLLLESLSSVLEQKIETDFNLKINISDNSTNNETFNYFNSHYFKNVKYIKRDPPVSAIEHLNIILNEIDSEYFMIFHDDDLMGHQMVSQLLHELISNDRLVAVGSNAKCLTNNTIGEIFAKRIKRDVIIVNPVNLIERYLKGKNYFVPFPSYMYRKIISNNIKFVIARGGKYADVSFLIEVAKIGPVLFKAKPLMSYRVHSQQDSQDTSFINRIALMNYISSKYGYHRRHKAMIKYRIRNLYDELWMPLSLDGSMPCLKKVIKIVNIIFRYSPFDFFPKILFRLVLHYYLNPQHYSKRKEAI